ncbi:MAG: glycosyltransferase family 1 protein [Deltaproteobacteria bacterium]|nr:glycosyltransferase family 1 protein [Deltaproteobacteria bacterium]
MRVALVSAGSRGDFQPMLALALLTRDAGHEAVVVASPDFEAPTRAFELPFRPVGQDMQPVLTGLADAATGGPLKTFRGFNSVVVELLGQQFRDLPGAVEGADMVLGGGLPLAAPSVAERLGVPYRHVAYCPVLFRSREHPPLMVPFLGLPGWLNGVLWRLSFAFYGRFIGPAINVHRNTLGLAPVSDFYRYIVGDGALLAADPALSPMPPDVEVPVRRVGFLALPEPGGLDPALEAFLGDGPTPLCVTFGSMPDSDPSGTTLMLLEALDQAGCRAVLVGGWAGLGAGPLPPTVHQVPSAPFGRLFPRVSAVVHHGGAGTTGTAARAGVPQVLVPHLMDQFWWARRLGALGVSPAPVPRPRLTAPRLARALTEVLHQPTFTARARALAAAPGTPLDLGPLLEEIRAGPPAGRWAA